MLDDETDDENMGMFMVDRALNGATGALAGVDDGNKDAGLQLPKPGWQPLPQ